MNPAEVWHTCRKATRREAEQWYPRANAWAHEVAREFEQPPEVVCGLIALLSPGVTWELNLKDVRGLLRWGPRGYTPTTWSRQRRKAVALLRGEPFGELVSYRTSPKVYSFRNNIADPRDTQCVTLDRWIARFHRGNDRLTWRQYEDLAQVYRDDAAALGIAPCALQACVWVHTRGEA